MKGLEAIELMKQGKMIKGGIWVYSMDSDGVIWLKTESQTGWIGAHMFNILANDYEEYIEPKSLTGWHVIGKGEDFFWIDGTNVDEDKNCFEEEYPGDNRFSTKEKAEEINFKQTLFRKLQRFSDENGGSGIVFGNDDRKYFIEYYSKGEKLAVDYVYRLYSFGQVYFASREIAEKAIELFHDDLIKYFTGDFGGEA